MRDGRRRLAGNAGDRVAEGHVLGRGLAALVEWRVVVVAGGVRLVVRAVAVGAVHPAEAGTRVEHIDSDGVALSNHPLVFGGVSRGVGGVVLFSPVIDPAGPVLARHEGAVSTEML